MPRNRSRAALARRAASAEHLPSSPVTVWSHRLSDPAPSKALSIAPRHNHAPYAPTACTSSPGCRTPRQGASIEGDCRSIATRASTVKMRGSLKASYWPGRPTRRGGRSDPSWRWWPAAPAACRPTARSFGGRESVEAPVVLPLGTADKAIVGGARGFCGEGASTGVHVSAEGNASKSNSNMVRPWQLRPAHRACRSAQSDAA
mmetsp:Transcript_55380/g.173701  ORF Transcript_55380/g.173701 Transcript_55380/m.173701 type:complete len:203 (-) Transcript_55380:3-611(-)